MKISIPTPAALPAAAAEFVAAMGERRLFAFRAPMGAGKTTFISEICKALGADDEASSPTFSIINEYHGSALGRPIYHFDFYRIEDLAEALDMGLDDYFESGSVCLMEWPENVEPLLPDEVVNVEIKVDADGGREVSLES